MSDLVLFDTSILLRASTTTWITRTSVSRSGIRLVLEHCAPASPNKRSGILLGLDAPRDTPAPRACRDPKHLAVFPVIAPKPTTFRTCWHPWGGCGGSAAPRSMTAPGTHRARQRHRHSLHVQRPPLSPVRAPLAGGQPDHHADPLTDRPCRMSILLARRPSLQLLAAHARPIVQALRQRGFCLGIGRHALPV